MIMMMVMEVGSWHRKDTISAMVGGENLISRQSNLCGQEDDKQRAREGQRQGHRDVLGWDGKNNTDDGRGVAKRRDAASCR